MMEPMSDHEDGRWPPVTFAKRACLCRLRSLADAAAATAIMTTTNLVNFVGPAPFQARPFSWVPNPYSHRCSVLCNHPLCPEDRAELLEQLVPGASRTFDDMTNEDQFALMQQTLARNVERLNATDSQRKKIIAQVSQEMLRHFLRKPVDDPLLLKRRLTRSASASTRLMTGKYKLCPVTNEGTWDTCKDPIQVDVPRRPCRSMVVYKPPSYVPFREFNNKPSSILTNIQREPPKVTSGFPRGKFGSPVPINRFVSSTGSTSSLTPSGDTLASDEKNQNEKGEGTAATHNKKKKKKKHRIKQHSKKSKKDKKAKTPNVVQTEPVLSTYDSDSDFSDTENEPNELTVNDKMDGQMIPYRTASILPGAKSVNMRKRLYRTRLGLPIESYLRAEIEDPITLVETGILDGVDLTLYRALSPDSRHTLRNEKRRELERQRRQKQRERDLDEELANSSLTPEKFRELENILQSSRQSSAAKIKSTPEDTTAQAAEHPESPSSQDVPSHILRCPLAMTRDACRFEIPMDVRQLQTMKPPEYLRNYCIPSSYLKTIFTRSFAKYKGLNGNLSYDIISQALSVVLGQDLTQPQLQKLHQLSAISKDTSVDVKLFGGYVGLAMRICCQDMEPWLEQCSEKDIIETMDFSALRLHWNQSSIESDTRKLLEFIHSA